MRLDKWFAVSSGFNKLFRLETFLIKFLDGQEMKVILIALLINGLWKMIYSKSKSPPSLLWPKFLKNYKNIKVSGFLNKIILKILHFKGKNLRYKQCILLKII